MRPPILHDIHDPLCGWCYAAAPLVRAAVRNKVPVVLHAGGLWDPAMHATDAKRRMMRKTDARISRLTGQTFGPAYLDGLLIDPASAGGGPCRPAHPRHAHADEEPRAPRLPELSPPTGWRVRAPASRGLLRSPGQLHRPDPSGGIVQGAGTRRAMPSGGNRASLGCDRPLDAVHGGSSRGLNISHHAGTARKRCRARSRSDASCSPTRPFIDRKPCGAPG